MAVKGDPFEREVIERLRAEREKNTRLEHRLIEKDAIIKQLKAFHEELAGAFVDCQL
jgi:hypothetical protein